jgi:heme/copper-type cytochrome/quinol oxidase subunit 2
MYIICILTIILIIILNKCNIEKVKRRKSPHYPSHKKEKVRVFWNGIPKYTRIFTDYLSLFDCNEFGTKNPAPPSDCHPCPRGGVQGNK